MFKESFNLIQNNFHSKITEKYLFKKTAEYKFINNLMKVLAGEQHSLFEHQGKARDMMLQEHSLL